MVLHCCKHLQPRLAGIENPSGLLVGSGSGDEVLHFRRVFASPRVFGLDAEERFSPPARAEGCVFLSDAKGLPFVPDSFDFVAAFNSLEHVGDPTLALDEIRRVLRPGGWFYVGVPNSQRLVGYLGSFDASTWQKITWNLADWWVRLRGSFCNESGAHAGFGLEELARLLENRFDKVEFLTEDYLRFKYTGRLPKPLLDVLLTRHIVNYSAPALYALCRKPEKA
jgi:SAM-dependent methyltransferase